MILFSASKVREGFVMVMDSRAVCTRWVGHEKKCFAARRSVSSGFDSKGSSGMQRTLHVDCFFCSLLAVLV